ncbi:MAG: DUF6531 domain-containing protein, partial [Candidatus Thiodiazotropha endolucinida]
MVFKANKILIIFYLYLLIRPIVSSADYWPYKWYAGTASEELFANPAEACQNFDMASIGYPFLEFVSAELNYPHEPERGAKCWHQQTPGVLVNQVNAAIRYVDYFITLPPQFCPTEGNPCNPATGEKIQTEVDYLMAGKGLEISRHYSSQDHTIGDGYFNMGPRWRHNYSSRFDGYGRIRTSTEGLISISENYLTPSDACIFGWIDITEEYPLLNNSNASYDDGICRVSISGNTVLTLPIHSVASGRKDLGGSPISMHYISRGNGNGYTFQSIDNEWKDLNSTSSTLHRQGLSWLFADEKGFKEQYYAGKLISRKSTTGQTINFTYDYKGRLSLVTGYYGDTLSYYYNSKDLLIKITTPSGDVKYSYDDLGRLISVSYTDDSTKTYHYEDPNSAFLLTGITDEKGERYTTWDYDAKGRVILSEHANSAEQTTLTYNTDGSTTVTDAAGAERNYHFVVKQGAIKVDHIEGDRCTTCSSGGTQAYTYDTNGFVASKT